MWDIMGSTSSSAWAALAALAAAALLMLAFFAAPSLADSSTKVTELPARILIAESTRERPTFLVLQSSSPNVALIIVNTSPFLIFPDCKEVQEVSGKYLSLVTTTFFAYV